MPVSETTACYFGGDAARLNVWRRQGGLMRNNEISEHKLTDKKRPGANPRRSLQVEQVKAVLLYGHVPHLKRNKYELLFPNNEPILHNLDENFTHILNTNDFISPGP